ncbi:MAG: hypothetical protein AAFZ58_09505 [Pseudomonadota bacterium]
MRPTALRNTLVIGVLGSLMLLTRGGWFSDALNVTLHDASWAVFLLAGLMVGRGYAFALLAACAFTLDVTALCGGSLTNLVGCLRPSYIALPLAWLVLFMTGRLLAGPVQDARKGNQWLTLAGGALGATAFAYVLTNVAFYAWSGFYDQLTIAAYLTQTLPFAAWTGVYTLLYTVAIVAVFRLAALPVSAQPESA